MTTDIVDAPAPQATNAGTRMPQGFADVLFALGAMGYMPYAQQQRRFRLGHASAAGRTFDRIVAIARARGFRQRRQLIGAVRRGRATPFAMDVITAVCAFVTEHELRAEFDRLARIQSFMDGTPTINAAWPHPATPATTTAAMPHHNGRKATEG